MKKIFGLFLLAPLIWSCSSDDDSTSQQSALVNTQWTPEKVVPVIPFIGESDDYAQFYPHQTNCDKDYVVFLEQNEMKTYMHNETCMVDEQVQNWQEDGNNITIKYMGYNISGQMSGENSNQMVIESDLSEYADLIADLNLDIPSIDGVTVKLYLNKQNN